MVSIVLSLYNEAAGVTDFYQSLIGTLKRIPETRFEVLWVNDGSSDGTQEIINRLTDDTSNDLISHTKIEFSRNFGHEAAMIAGIDHATGDVIICMDSDGQHPPEEIPKMLEAHRAGFDIALMERTGRADHSFIKKGFSRAFYRTINSLSEIRFRENSSDFFLISGDVGKILRTRFRDSNRFIRGFIQSLGFSVTVIPYNAPARKFGESNYSYYRLFKLAMNSIFAFSNKPLRLSILISVMFILFTMGFSVYSLVMYVNVDVIPSGYTTIILFLAFSFSLLFLTLTILSLYFEKAFEEIRERPIYIVKKITKPEG